LALILAAALAVTLAAPVSASAGWDRLPTPVELIETVIK
jgi:hypothetical protein